MEEIDHKTVWFSFVTIGGQKFYGKISDNEVVKLGRANVRIFTPLILSSKNENKSLSSMVIPYENRENVLIFNTVGFFHWVQVKEEAMIDELDNKEREVFSQMATL